MVKECVITIVKVATVTIVVSKAVKLLGKKDMADVITFGGWCICGVHILKAVTYITNNPPELLTGITGLVSKLNMFADKLENLPFLGLK